MKSRGVSRFLVVLLAGICTSKLAAQSVPPANGIISEATQKLRLADGYGGLPLSFEANRGQTDSRVKFLSRGAGQTLFLTSTEAVLVLNKAFDQKPDLSDFTNLSLQRPARSAVLRMRLLGADPLAEVTGFESLRGTSNYFIGNDPTQWRTNVPTYGKVRYSQIYPGIDLVYYGNQRQLEYDFIVTPGADPAQIRVAIRGASKLSIDADGNAVVGRKDGDVRLLKPRLYQEVRGDKIEVAGGYVLKGNELRFAIASYDHSQRLVIDPALVYSTYLGGSGGDSPTGIAVDSSGNAYVSGQTNSLNFPGALGNGKFQNFVVKLNAAGTAVLYSTYISGSGTELATAIAVDSTGSAYVTGYTNSTDFPTRSPLQSANAGGYDAFVAKLDATGNLVYSTYLGGGKDDTANAIALDSSGNIYLAGQTNSTNFPGVTSSSPQRSLVGNFSNAFVAKLNAAGSSISYSTYLGGNGGDYAKGIAVDSSGNAYVVGTTASTNFPVTPNPLQSAFGGGSNDAFVSMLNAAGTALVYSTYLGGNDNDFGNAIAVDFSGNVYVTGYTASTNFPGVTSSSIQPVNGGNYTGIVAKLNASGTALVYSTYLGGNALDVGNGIAVDSSGNAYVTGTTRSTNFVGVTAASIQPVNGGGADAFVSELNAGGTALVFSTYLGGSGNDSGNGVALDSTGNIYVTGDTASTNFPVTANPLQSTYGGSNDAFIAKLSAESTGAATTTMLAPSANPSVFGQQVSLTATVSPTSSSSLTPTGNVTFDDGSAVLGTIALSAGTAIFNTSALPAGSHSITTSYAGDSNFAASTSTALSQIVNQGTTTATVTSSPTPGVLGQSVTFTAIVTAVAPASGMSTGTVTFLDGSTSLGPGTLSGGQAIFTTSSLTTGSHSITATYAGDNNFLGTTSPAITLAVKQGTTTSLTASPNPSNTGQPVTLSATVAASATSATPPPSSSGGATPTGTVTFLDGTTTLGAGTLSSGTATFITSSLTAGIHSLTASYGGDTNFASSTSSAASQTVNLLITVNETIKVTDASAVVPSVMIPVNESITVSDVPTVLPSVMIPVNESISVRDTPAILPSVVIPVNETIFVTDAPMVANTPTGSNVVVNPTDTTTGKTLTGVTFTNVSQAGITSLTTGSTGAPPPPGFQPGTPLVYYDISTSASYTGPINICINFTGIVFPGSAPPHFFHFENGAWVDHTLSVDVINMISCGSVASLSPFAIFQPAVIATTTSISAPGVSYGTPASVMVSVSSSVGTVGGGVTLSVDGGAASTMALSNGSTVFNLGVLNAGGHSLSASFMAQGNFSASSAPGTLTVSPAHLAVTANPAMRPYGAANPAFSANFSGFVNGDSGSVLTGLLTCVPTAMSNSSVGMYPIICSGLSSPNYSISFLNGTLSVVPETTSLSLTISPSSIVLGQSTTVTVTLTAPDMVIPIDPSVLASVAVTSPIVSDILTNNGSCALAPAGTGIATCSVTLTAVEPNGRTLNASFPGTANLAASNNLANLIVTAPLESKVSCLKSDFRNVAVPGGSYLWLNSIFKIRDVNKQKVTITFFQSSVQFQYRDASNNLISVNQALPDAKITIDPSVSLASTMFDAVDNVWITTVPFDLDDATFLTGIPWLVPAGGIPADIEPVTWCGTFASDTAGVDIGWRWSAAAYSSFSGDNTVLGVKPMNTDHDNPPVNRDNAGTPENFKSFVFPGARGKGGKNFTGSYSGSAEIE